MRIAIHAADLDHKRIDGTRVYIFNMLKYFGALDEANSFCIYHQNDFNPRLAPPTFLNYSIKQMPFPTLWTQLRFAWELFFDNPDVLWMPVHNVPMLRRKKLKVVVTIHDLAFKIFPDYFPENDLVKLNRLSDYAVKNADRLIAVSESTKKDILKFYPEVDAGKIAVIHHGYDCELFSDHISMHAQNEILSELEIQNSKFILYVGAIQPRKNLGTLIAAFEKIKKTHGDFKLVLAGAPAWQAEATLDAIAASPHNNDIIVTGTLPFDHLPVLYRSAAVFVFPSLYEGFGIPVLEAMATGVPTILADNSSLREVGGEAAIYFETENPENLSEKIDSVLSDDALRSSMIEKGLRHSANFSWEKCAAKTLDNISKW